MNRRFIEPRVHQRQEARIQRRCLWFVRLFLKGKQYYGLRQKSMFLNASVLQELLYFKM